MPTAMCPDIHPLKKRNLDPIKEAMWAILWGESPKWHSVGAAKLQQLLFLLCFCAWVGMLGTERNMRGVVALPKGSHFSCCGSSFLLLWELNGAVGWSFGRMRQICCSQNSSCIGFLGMVKKMQMSEIAKRIPWNCTIKSNCGLKEKKETLQTVFTHVFPLNPHL